VIVASAELEWNGRKASPRDDRNAGPQRMWSGE